MQSPLTAGVACSRAVSCVGCTHLSAVVGYICGGRVGGVSLGLIVGVG